MKRKAVPSLVELFHEFSSPPSKVFAAWSTPDALLRWAKPSDEWRMKITSFEFATGADQVSEFGPPGGPTFVNRMRYHDIVPDERIVMAGSMASADATMFVGVLTLEFLPSARGCRLKLTEQGVFLDDTDRSGNHVAGWNEMLERLQLELGQSPAGKAH
jgi:uncharacterized protein YndB with AHSA1/START domain